MPSRQHKQVAAGVSPASSAGVPPPREERSRGETPPRTRRLDTRSAHLSAILAHRHPTGAAFLAAKTVVRASAFDGDDSARSHFTR